MLTWTTLGYIDPATGSIVMGALVAGGAGVAAAAVQGKARLRSVFKRGGGTEFDSGQGSDRQDVSVDADASTVKDTDGPEHEDRVLDDADRESAESR